MKRKVGCLLACLFALGLFLEVAGLPMLSSLAIRFEKSVLMEASEFDQKESETAALEFTFLAIAPEYFFPSFDLDEPIKNFLADNASDTAPPSQLFIQIHNLRL
jgi:hypothetical protein